MSQPVHTPGPSTTGTSEHEPDRIYIYGEVGPNKPRIAIVEFGLKCGQDIPAETEGNARLLAAAYNAFDSAAKRLGCNAVELAERMADGAIAELVQALTGMIGCFENVPQEASMGFDSPPEPASEWDMNAFMELHHARALIAKVKGGAA
jgi:hypothetical protein